MTLTANKAGQPVKGLRKRPEKRRRSGKSAQPTEIRAEPSASESSMTFNRHIEETLKQIEQEPVVDKEKVKRIKAAIDAGTYVVDPDTIAQKMMDMEVKLTKSKKDD